MMIQSQFEAEVRAGDILTLEELNRAFSAWVAVSYHREPNSETKQSPEDRPCGADERRPWAR